MRYRGTTYSPWMICRHQISSSRHGKSRTDRLHVRALSGGEIPDLDDVCTSAAQQLRTVGRERQASDPVIQVELALEPTKLRDGTLRGTGVLRQLLIGLCRARPRFQPDLHHLPVAAGNGDQFLFHRLAVLDRLE